MLAVRICLCLKYLSVPMQAQPWNLAANWFFLVHSTTWCSDRNLVERDCGKGFLWGLSTPSTSLGRLLCYSICLQVQGFPLICWIKPRRCSLPMSGLCLLQRLCQSKGRAIQAHIKIHTTAYEKVSRLCFLCCRHCNWFVVYLFAYWTCLLFLFWAVVQIMGFPLTPVTCCPWGRS